MLSAFEKISPFVPRYRSRPAMLTTEVVDVTTDRSLSC